MDFLSYDGFAFADLDMWAGVEADRFRGTWRVDARYVGRVGAPGHLGPGEVSPTTIELTVGFEGDNDNGDDLILTFDRLIGRLNPLDQSPRRKLVARRPDGTVVWRYANVSLPHGVDPSGSLSSIIVRFTSADPLWRTETARTVLLSAPLQQVAGTHPAVSLPNAGQAAVHPVYRIDWDGTLRAVGSGTSTLGWRYRWTLRVTNTLPHTVDRWPYWIDLGATDGFLVVAGTARTDGNDLRVLYQGKELPRNLVAWNSQQSYALVLLPRMEAGQTIELDVVYGNSVAGAPKTLRYPDLPACQTDWALGATLTGSTTTVIQVTEATAMTLALALGGTVVGRTATNYGVSRTIQGYVTSGGITSIITDTFPAAWGAAQGILVLSSRNGRLLWNTATTERGNNPSRGRWYLSSGESPPDIVDYRVPAAWRSALHQDGRDKKGQRRYSRVSVGGDLDSFAILDASRTWENGPSVPEEGAADGVALSLPFPITAYRTQMKRTNPSGMCRSIVASRGQGGEQYRELAGIATHAATETTWDPGTLVPPTDTLHLYAGLIPAEGDEIPPDWRSDQGTTTTSGTTTSLTDGEQDWVEGQWIGATLRITSGKLKGTSEIITANTPTTLSWSGATSSAIGGDNTYELRHKPLLATLRDFLECNVDVDLSGLVVSGSLAGETPVHHHRGRLWIGGGYGASPTRRGEIRIGSAADWVLTTAAEELRLDSARRAAAIHTVATGAVVRHLVEPIVQWVGITTEDGVTGERRSQDGMPLPIGVNPLANPGAEVDTAGVTIEVAGGVSATLARDTSPVFQGAGAFRLRFNSTPGGAGAWAQLVWPAVAVHPGQMVELVAAMRSVASNLHGLLGVRWHDAAGVVISTSLAADVYANPGDVWLSLGEMFTAPATAATMHPLVRTGEADPGSSGDFFVDVVDPGSPVLWYDEHASRGIRIGASYTEGFLG